MSSKAKNTSGYTFHEDTPLQAITGYFESDKLSEKGQPLLVFETRMLQGVAPFGPQAGVITNDDLTPGVVEFLMNKKDEDGKAMFAHLLVKDGSAKATKAVTKNPVTVEEEDETEHGTAEEEAVVTASEAGGAKAKTVKAKATGAGNGKRKPVKKAVKKTEEEDFN